MTGLPRNRLENGLEEGPNGNRNHTGALAPGIPYKKTVFTFNVSRKAPPTAHVALGSGMVSHIG
jgi:hypothetical protein